MERKQNAVLAALLQVQDFLDEQNAVLGTINATGARSTLNEVVTNLSSRRADQDAHTRESKGARAKHLVARKSLLVYHMRAIANAARLEVSAAPALAGITAPFADAPTAELLSAAAGVQKVAEQNQEVLARVLGSGFIDQLRGAAAALQEAVESGRTSRAKRAAATAGVMAEVERGKTAVRVLDALVLQAVASDAALEREWKARRKFLATSGPSVGPKVPADAESHHDLVAPASPAVPVQKPAPVTPTAA